MSLMKQCNITSAPGNTTGVLRRTPIDEAIEAEYIRQGKHHLYLQHACHSVSQEPKETNEELKRQELHQLYLRLVEQGKRDLKKL